MAGIINVLQVTRQKLDTVIFLVPQTRTAPGNRNRNVSGSCKLMSPVSRLIWFEIHCGINNLKYGLWLLAQHRCVCRCVTVRRCVSSCSQLVESSLSVRSFFSKTEQDETQTLFQPQTPDKTRNIYRKKFSAYLFFAKRRLFPKRLHGDAALLRPGVRRVPTHLVETSSDGHRSARRSLHLLFLSEK